jgi:hypothetical protein
MDSVEFYPVLQIIEQLMRSFDDDQIIEQLMRSFNDDQNIEQVMRSFIENPDIDIYIVIDDMEQPRRTNLRPSEDDMLKRTSAEAA